MAKQVAKQNVEETKVEETQVTEVEETKETLLSKAKNKVKGINFKAAAKVVVVGAVSGALGYALGKRSAGDYTYDTESFDGSSNDDSSNVIDITEF